ncbi:phage portal protein [Heliobacterium mobile]|uniref:phage portal protein n=1 Tax=Heliobacterium mobile TaxID=28064 RepID=UPI0014780F69|nr:phage portal protein [Heliobacterium mobile]
MTVNITQWPPEGHDHRLQDYTRYRQLFLGKHSEVFARVQAWLDKELDKTIVYLVCNYAGLVSKISADLLFGEQVRVVAGDEDSPEQKAVDGIIQSNQLHTRCYEMALSSSWRGDAVIKVRFGKPSAWDKERAIIESVPPDIFFPDISGDNIQEMRGATLAWIKKAGNRQYLRTEIHEPGLIRNELWEMRGNQVGKRVPMATLPDYAAIPDEQETGYPGLLVRHVPNWRLDDMFWGISDYADMESLFDELNNRVSKISVILDKHSDPKLVLPPGLMRYDEATQRYYVERESLQTIEVDPEHTGDLPKYLVWDAQLEAAFKQIDQLLELLMMTSEVSPAAFGLDKNGTADSGRALKFRLIRTVAKINRKRLYFDQALKQALFAAQVLDVTHGQGSYTPAMPHIEWRDGLPTDDMEAAQVEQIRLQSGNTSVESSVRRLDGIDGKSLQEELDRIQADKPKPLESPIGPRVSLPPPKRGE